MRKEHLKSQWARNFFIKWKKLQPPIEPKRKN